MSGDWVIQAVINQRTWRYRKRVLKAYSDLFQQNPAELNAELATANSPFKNDRTTTVQLITRGNEQFILKRYNARNLWHRYKRAFRRSRAIRCWDMSEQFNLAGLNVAEPICVLEKRFGPIRQDAYFISRFIPGAELLDLLPTLGAQQQQAVASEIKVAFAKLRKNKLSHGDMKATNLLWLNEKIVFIDLDAARVHRRQQSWERAHRKDRRRFLKNWQGQPELARLFDGLE